MNTEASAAQPNSAAGVSQRRGKLLTSVVSTLGSEILGKVLLLIFFFLVAGLVPRDEMGVYSFCTATTTFLAIVVSFGLRLIVVRETARDRSQCRRFLETVMWQRLVMMGAAMAILVLLTYVVPDFRPIRLELLISAVSVCMLLYTDLGTAVCEGLEHMHWVPIINAVDGGTRILALGLLFLLPVRAWTVLTLVCLAQTLTAVVSLSCASRLLNGFPWPRRHPGLLPYVMREGAPLLFLGFAQRTYARFDWIFLGLAKNADVLAPYAVGYRIYEGLNLLGPGVMRGIVPRLTQSTAGSRELFCERLALLLKVMLLLNTFAAATAILHVGHVLSFFEEKYMDGEKPAMLLLCGLPFLAVTAAFYQAFLAHGMQKTMLFNGALIAGLNVLINVIAIPRWGTMGAAFATALPHAVAAVVAWSIFRRRVGPLGLQWAHVRCVIPAIPTILAGLWMPGHWTVVAAAQCLTFVGCAWVIRPFNQAEQAMLIRAIKGAT